MIAFLPSFYPHELFYSLIARYHVRTGRADVGADIDSFYPDRYNVPPDFEFLGKLRDDILPAATQLNPSAIGTELSARQRAYQ